MLQLFRAQKVLMEVEAREFSIARRLCSYIKESILAEPLSESKHEAFKVQDNAFLDDFVPEVDGLLP